MENKYQHQHHLLSKTYPVLDKGFVRLVDYMGNDDAIVQAARISYGKGTTTKRQDEDLIRYLVSHKHTGPLEMVELKFHVKLPIFVARQMVRHRTASLNEYSCRYSLVRPENYVPDLTQISKQSTTNKQGKEKKPIDIKLAEEIQQRWILGNEQANKNYDWMIGNDVARELARLGQEVSSYTEWYWKIDLHNLLHFLLLRTEDNAQWEIRQYANVIAAITKELCPITVQAWVEYCKNALSFSQEELRIVKELVKYKKNEIEFLLENAKMSNREKNTLIENLYTDKKPTVFSLPQALEDKEVK
jgi:thymidylate synthase (FAD)